MGIRSADQILGAARHSHADRSHRYPGLGTLLLVWAFIGASTSLRILLTASRPASKSDLILWIAYVACYLPWGFFTAVAFRLEERFPLGGNRWVANLSTLSASSVPVSLVAAPAMRAAFSGTLLLFGRPSPFSRSWTHWFYELFIGEFFFWLSIAGAYSIRTTLELQQQREAAMRLSLEKTRLGSDLKQAQLDLLRAKLNPHFLFNSLQNISVLTRKNPVVAGRMLAKLGDFLRSVLSADSQALTTLHEEVELLQHYVSLELMRFGDRVEFMAEIQPEAGRSFIPSFILQPLVENALVHGLRESVEEGVLCISAVVRDGRLIILVTDNGVGLSREQSRSPHAGLGLSTTRERLALLYPGQHQFTITSSSNAGTEVRIEIPHHTNGDRQPRQGGKRALTHR